MINIIKNNFITHNVSGQSVLTTLAIIVSLVIALSPVSIFASEDGVNYVFQTDGGSRPTSQTNNQNVAPAPYINSINPNFIYTNANSTITVNGGNFVSGSMVRIDGTTYPTNYLNSGKLSTQVSFSNTGTHGLSVVNPNGLTSNTSYFSVNTGSVQGASTSKTVKKTVTAKPVVNNVTTEEEYDYGALTSNAMFGSNTLMPSGLMQWVLFAILILLIVIIVRKIFVGDKERNKPLKHA